MALLNRCNKPPAGFIIKRWAFLIFLTGLFFHACTKNTEKPVLGEEYIESQTNVVLIDTFSVELSTVLIDTLATSGTGGLLVGNYRDNVFGKLSSRGYFQIGIPDEMETTELEEDRYDSLRLEIRYNGYSIGDTTRNQKLCVYRLTEAIQSDDDGIDKTASFDYDPVPIGSHSFTPSPNGASDTIFIKISDGIGLDLFVKLQEKSEVLTDNDQFESYFHGLALAADETNGGAIVGYLATAADAKLVLYTSRSVALTTEVISYEFKLQNTSKQFNGITHDFSSTPLNPLIEQKTALSSSKTDGLSFLQGGTALAIKVSLPSFQNILLLERGVILKAQLSISPSRDSDDFDLPSALTLCESDEKNHCGEEVASSVLTIDDLYEEETTYSFTITDEINNDLSDSYVDPEKGFLITLASVTQKSTFNRLMVDAKNKNTKLKIYYLYY